MIGVRNGLQTISVPAIQVICLKIVNYPAMIAKVLKAITNYQQLYHALMIIIDALNGQQTTNAQAIQVTCLKIVNYHAVRVWRYDDTGCKDFKEDCYKYPEFGAEKCTFWAQQGRCVSNLIYMLDNCWKSCGKF